MKISVIGCGYVGLVSAACLAHLGHKVVCIDHDPETVISINAGKPRFREPGLRKLLEEGRQAGRLTATEPGETPIIESDITFICVGTPDNAGIIDLKQIRAASRLIGRALAKKTGNHIVVTKSTVVPGTSVNIIGTEIKLLAPETNFTLCMNPEFLRQGSAVKDFMNPDRIVVGSNDIEIAKVVLEIYKDLDSEELLTSIQNAELIKYASNALLATLISFSNEISDICDGTPNSDVNVVMDGVKLDRRISTKIDGEIITPEIVQYLVAGGGFGGSCLPKDIKALASYGASVGFPTALLNAVININKQRVPRTIQLAIDELDDLKDTNVTLLGLAFKPGTDDIRDSPSIEILKKLCENQANVTVWDPMAPVDCVSHFPNIKRSPTPLIALENADCCIIGTAWPELRGMNWSEISSHMRTPVIVDSRSALIDMKLPKGIIYRALGRGQ